MTKPTTKKKNINQFNKGRLKLKPVPVNYPKPTRTVLLAEDDQLLIDLYQERFKQENFHLVLAKTGYEAVQKAGLNIDLILLDILLPEMNGFETLKRLKSQPKTRDIPVMVLTNLGSEQSDKDKDLALALGAIDYLVKSYHDPDNLVEIINKRLYPPN
jgi:CheY-like chemotaxis protein